jgi:hypothetical protein
MPLGSCLVAPEHDFIVALATPLCPRDNPEAVSAADATRGSRNVVSLRVD